MSAFPESHVICGISATAGHHWQHRIRAASCVQTSELWFASGGGLIGGAPPWAIRNQLTDSRRPPFPVSWTCEFWPFSNIVGVYKPGKTDLDTIRAKRRVKAGRDFCVHLAGGLPLKKAADRGGCFAGRLSRINGSQGGVSAVGALNLLSFRTGARPMRHSMHYPHRAPTLLTLDLIVGATRFGH